MSVRNILAALLLASSVGALSTAAQAASTSAHAMVVSGQAHGGVGPFGCATSGPQAMEGHWFGSASVGLPTEGYISCNLSGGIQNTSNLAGASFATQDVSHAFNGGLNTLSSTATAGFDKLGVKTTGSFTGETNGFSYHSGEAAAYSTDSLLLPGSGAGTIQFGFSVDGSANSVGNSETFVYLNYELGGGPIFTAFNAITSYGTSSVSSPTGGGAALRPPERALADRGSPTPSPIRSPWARTSISVSVCSPPATRGRSPAWPTTISFQRRRSPASRSLMRQVARSISRSRELPVRSTTPTARTFRRRAVSRNPGPGP